MMLAGWPSGVVHRGPETRHSLGNGCKTRALRKAAGRGPVPVAPFAEAKLASHTSAKPRTHGTHALGDRALPDLMAAANAAVPEEGFVRAIFKASSFVARVFNDLMNSSSMHDIVRFLRLGAVGTWVQMFRN